MGHSVVNARLIGKGRKRETLRSAVDSVKHDGRIHDLAET